MALKAIFIVPVIKYFDIKLLNDTELKEKSRKRREKKWWEKKMFMLIQKCFSNKQGMEGDKGYMNV